MHSRPALAGQRQRSRHLESPGIVTAVELQRAPRLPSPPGIHRFRPTEPPAANWFRGRPAGGSTQGASADGANGSAASNLRETVAVVELRAGIPLRFAAGGPKTPALPNRRLRTGSRFASGGVERRDRRHRVRARRRRPFPCLELPERARRRPSPTSAESRAGRPAPLRARAEPGRREANRRAPAESRAGHPSHSAAAPKPAGRQRSRQRSRPAPAAPAQPPSEATNSSYAAAESRPAPAASGSASRSRTSQPSP